MFRTAQDIIEIGRELIAVKERIGLDGVNQDDPEREGSTRWLDREFGMSRRTANQIHGGLTPVIREPIVGAMQISNNDWTDEVAIELARQLCKAPNGEIELRPLPMPR
jgi:hypothetical protein